MNLSNIVGPYVAAVNPWLISTWQQSSGFEIVPGGAQKPNYAQGVSVQVQCQALTYKDLVQLEGVNINGVSQALYVNGNIEGVSRPDARGGDLFTLPDETIWLVVHVLENWARTGGWTKCAVVQQNGS